MLQVENLSVAFGHSKHPVFAVNNVSFSLDAGQTLGIVGESGSGKSVSAKSIMRLMPEKELYQFSGSILWKTSEGETIDLMRLRERDMQRIRGKEISMIFQNPGSSLNPVMKCGDQILEMMIRHNGWKKNDKKPVYDWLEKVQLHEVERIYNSYPHQLSGGQLQRIMIAIALCSHPRLLIADEPTTALDVTVQKAVLDLINQLKTELNIGVIFISHDLGVIANVADHVAVMSSGQIVENGPLKEVLSAPKHPYTKALLACRPPLDKKLHRLPVVEQFMNRNQKDFQPEYQLISVLEQQGKIEKLMDNPPLLEVKGLKTYFKPTGNWFEKRKPPVKAVDNVSFNVFPGEVLGVVGESGCGKTTLARTIVGLEKPVEGIIQFEGQPITDLDDQAFRHYRRSIQIVFQDPYSSLNPRQSIGEMIEEPMKVFNLFRSKKERLEKVEHLLVSVGLKTSDCSKYPRAFSGGQLQRISIARALAVDPRFLICDESVSSLDVSVQAQVLNLLMDLKDKFGLTYIFVSHDFSVVKYISDRIIVMKDGEIIESGPSYELFNSPKQDYTRKLLGAIPRV